MGDQPPLGGSSLSRVVLTPKEEDFSPRAKRKRDEGTVAAAAAAAAPQRAPNTTGFPCEAVTNELIFVQAAKLVAKGVLAVLSTGEAEKRLRVSGAAEPSKLCPSCWCRRPAATSAWPFVDGPGLLRGYAGNRLAQRQMDEPPRDIVQRGMLEMAWPEPLALGPARTAWDVLMNGAEVDVRAVPAPRLSLAAAAAESDRGTQS